MILKLNHTNKSTINTRPMFAVCHFLFDVCSAEFYHMETLFPILKKQLS